ncbi:MULTISPECIES: ketopantoate reductase family protein [Paenibacillus]|uniref:2-dehydropantoate 2-reductase n=1 Tax=Paenibacillus pabuli TaxID=1472 RepID=A0A855XZF8_9BACL|nr:MULTISPECIES: 2-dehydropantoate 2-reductase [Paenibacillus]PWW43086.1 2-dehydropantoate 2-reductase [Paenibacillus pabuli]PXW08993.1 2-dehydropantoate 2-reductase [Paenibacillus taichungensis]RAJ03349.1 2-dehydropantoate 2-reductase [Paenibacillus pabuli]
MIIDVVGSGSLGLLYGGKLQDAGNEVRFWTRTAEQANKLSVEGFKVTEREKTIQISSDQIQVKPITELTRVWEHSPGDWLLLMVKQTAIKDVIHEIASLKTRVLNIACFQNGIGHLNVVQSNMPHSNIYSVITTEGAKRQQDGVIRAGIGETWLGKSSDIRSSSLMPMDQNESIRLQGLLQQAGFGCTVSNEIDKLIYRKLLINAVINPLTAIWRIPNGELITREERIMFMRQLYDEAWAVYEASGILIDGDVWDQILSVCRSTASNTSSMLSDVLHGQQTEVQSITGQIVSMACRCGLSAPTHEVLLHLIEGMQPEGVS